MSAIINQEKLEQLLAEGKLAEAIKLLEVYFQTAPTPAEAGEAYVGLATLYLKIQNDLDEKRLALLDEAIANLEELVQDQKKFEEQVKIATLKQSLK